MRSDLEPRLRGLYRTPADGQAAHERAHEDELVAAVARRGGVGAGAGGRTRGWTSWLRLPRLALAGVLGVAVAVGACVMPAEYPVSLGYELDITLPAERWAAFDHDAFTRHLDAWPGVERVEIRMHGVRREHADARGRAVVDTDEARMQLFVFGDALDPDALLADLQAGFPQLEGAELRDVPLSGTVHGTFGGALSHRYLDVVIDRHGVEEAERQLLAALAAEGIPTENTRVDITEERGANGEHRIEVRVQAEHHEPEHHEPEHADPEP